MTNDNELNQKIIDITMLIQNKHPELAKYLAEMTVTIPDKKYPKVDQESLQEYYNSLLALLSKYELELNQKWTINN